MSILKGLRPFFTVGFLFACFFLLQAQEQFSKIVILRWDNQFRYDSTTNSEECLLRFTDCNLDACGSLLPVYRLVIPLPAADLYPKVTLTEKLSDEFRHPNIAGKEWLTDDFGIKTSTHLQKNSWYAEVEITPVRKNALTGYPECLSRFVLNLNWEKNQSFKTIEEMASWPEASVLATGNWLKFNVQGRGMVKITGAELQASGVTIANINPAAVKVYGTGNPPLPEANNQTRPYDLTENHIWVVGAEDGKIDGSDYILFYNPGHEKWSYSTSNKRFIRTANPYATQSTFLITWDGATGKRLSAKQATTSSPSVTYNTFTDYFAHETNTSNLIGTGRQWFGEEFSLYDTKDFQLNFANPVLPSRAVIASQVAGRSFSSSRFYVNIAGNRILSQPIPIVTSTSLEANYAFDRFDTIGFNLTTANPTLTYEYNRYSSSSEGWLDYFEVNYTRHLTFTAPSMVFSVPGRTSSGWVAQYQIAQAPANLQIWDVTNPQQPQKISWTSSGSTAIFNDMADTLRTYVAFDGSGFLSASGWQRVANQNLHALKEVDYIIISYPGFLEQANRLADFHRQRGLNVEVTTPELIYNEFSSGSQDLAAMRDFLRMVYLRNGRGHELRWVLLFGDASYDYLNRLEVNHNFVPTWQSTISLSPANSYATDDYFGLYDLTEGNDCNGYIDVGIGRLLAKSSEEAEAMVDKIIGYHNTTPENMRDWRNVICFVADDEDSDTHVKQSDNMARMIDTTYRQFNIDKIYFDAYPQVSSPGGQRYPDASDAINRRVENGALIMNYTGHGGELGWAHERVLEISDINSWRNLNNLPFFITATCEFSRYDDPLRESAGEKVFTNPLGGGIGLFTTSRLTYSGSNEQINRSFLSVLLARSNGRYLTLGEAVEKAKQTNGNNLNGRKFVLIGDPAMTLAFPEFYAETTSIEYGTSGTHADTISALDEITIKGRIRDAQGNTLTSFNGDLFPTVYDKVQQIRTLGNDPASPVYNFALRKNVLYKGQNEVNSGEFTFSFIVPRDIEYRYDAGRISLYARNNETDATGWSHDFIVGGYSKNIADDNTPPVITLYINDTHFQDGGITDQNPVLLAFINDESGINVSGAGIGHDITAVIDEETGSPYILNDFYRSTLNTYKSGRVDYPMYNLSEGVHTLKVTAWDVHNNPASAFITFKVVNGESMALENILTYPNPFVDQVKFEFEHNMQNSNLTMELEIVNLLGQRLAVIEKNVDAGGFRTEPIIWDGRDNNGHPIASGFYLYRLRISAPDGKFAEKTGRIIKSGHTN